uniref:C2H2-type domain-containing protein n=1 Tax=Biomphalaria glabrata TaxID=6526 RepID=A0A2C9K3G9_BIOGL
MIYTALQSTILQDVEEHSQDEQDTSSIAHQMPPQNLSTPTQQQQHPEHHQMSQSLVEQHTVVSMTDQHSALEHAHSMAEHAAHSMLDLSETGSSLEHLAGGGHSSQSLVDLTTGRNPDQTIDSVSANGRRQNQMHDRIGLNEGGRDLGSLGGGNRPLSGLGGGSLSDRQNQPMRNMTPVGGDSRGVHGGGMGNSLSSDGHGSVGLAGNGNGLPDQGGFNPEQSQNLLDSMSSRGRPPSMGGGQHNLGTVDQQQHGAQQLPPHMRGLAEHQSHQHQSLVDHHSQQQNMDNNTNSHNGRGGMYGLDSGNGQLHSRPGSTLLSEGNNRNDARDLSRSVYNSSSGDRPQGHHSTSLIEETIAAVASNLNKSPDGGLMPGPLPPNSMMGHLGTLGLIRASSTGSHLGHGNDETLADLVGRHHPHGIPMLSERASQSLSGLMDDHSIGASSSGHGPGRELEKTHPCLTCLKMFRSKQQLAQHSLVHTGVRKHICSFCDRAFKQLSHLQQHVRIHTGERKYMCKFCERGFKQLSHLQKHTRIHTGEKPYRCKFENCERAFAQLSNLQHHMRNHDDQVKKEATRIHKCQICHRCYTNESSLKSHTLKMHIHIKPIDQHPLPTPKKRRKRKNKDLYGGAPTMVPVSSADGNFNNTMQGMKAGGSRTRSPTSSDDDEIIFVGEQMGPPRVDNFGGAGGALGGQGQLLQGPGGRGHDFSHQIQFTGMGNFSRGADPLALLASANRFTLQDNMMSSLGGPLNSFSDQLAFRDAALLNSRFGDLRGVSQGSSFDDRFSAGTFNPQQPQQQQQQRDRDNFGNHGDINNRGGTGGNNNGDNNMQPQNGNTNENRNQIPAHNQGMLRGAGMGGLSGSIQGMMHGAGQGGLSNLMKQIKQEPLDYFPSSCQGGDQFAAMGVNSGGGFLSPQHIINSHLRGQLPSLNVPLIRDHFTHNQMLPHSTSSVSSSTSAINVVSSSASSTLSSTPASLTSLPLPLSHMGLYHQSHFTSQRMGGLHPSPASTPSSQMSVGAANLPSNLSTQGGRSPLEQEDLRCFSPIRN